jgi:hypothetical protein
MVYTGCPIRVYIHDPWIRGRLCGQNFPVHIELSTAYSECWQVFLDL